MRALRTGPVLLLAGVLTLAGCTGDAGDEPDAAAPPTSEGSAAPTAPATPTTPDLPSPVTTEGPVTEPLMEPVWLVRSTGTEESSSYDLDEQGVLVDGDVAVYWALDTVLGVSVADGTTRWQNKIDMGGEIVERAGRGVHHGHLWSYTYSETNTEDFDRRGEHLVTIDVSSGVVAGDETIGSYGAATAMAYQAGVQLVALDEGIHEVTDRGKLERVLPARALSVPGARISQMTPVAGTGVVTLEIQDRNAHQVAIAGYDVASRQLLWSVDVADLAATRAGQDYVYLSRGDGRYVTQRDWDAQHTEMVHLWTLDPQTGEVLHHLRHRPSGHGDRYHQMRITENDLGPEAPYGLIPVDGDIVFVDFQGISRYDPISEEWVWTLRRDAMTSRNGDDDWARFALGPVSADGSLVYAFLSAGYSGDLMAIDLATGELKGRWAMDDAQESGLVSEPLMAETGAGLLLARNRMSDPALLEEKAKPLGPLNDLGLVRFPELG